MRPIPPSYRPHRFDLPLFGTVGTFAAPEVASLEHLAFSGKHPADSEWPAVSCLFCSGREVARDASFRTIWTAAQVFPDSPLGVSSNARQQMDEAAAR